MERAQQALVILEDRDSSLSSRLFSIHDSLQVLRSHGVLDVSVQAERLTEYYAQALSLNNTGGAKAIKKEFEKLMEYGGDYFRLFEELELVQEQLSIIRFEKENLSTELDAQLTNKFVINKAVAPVGAVFTLLCLISGSMWGKPMWGTWWVWDARLTSVAILFIVYLLIIFLNQTFENRDVREKTIAIFILIGSVNLPIIKFSVDWWNTLHQPASVSKLSSPSIDISMLQPLLMMTLAFSLIGIIIAILRIKAEILIRKKYL